MKKKLSSLTFFASLFLFVVFFAHSQAAEEIFLPASCPKSGLIVFPDDTRNVNGMALLGEMIDCAKTKIDLVMYTLTSDMLVDKLVTARTRGVAVRVIKEMKVFQYPGKTVPDADKDPQLQKLRNAGIEIHSLPKRFSDISDKAQAHHKVLLVDDQYAVVMSTNWDIGSAYITRDFGLVLTKEKYAAELTEIQAVFEADWNNVVITPQNPNLVWGPDNQIQKLHALIESATHSISIYQQGFSDPEMTTLLCTKAKAGVKVNLLMGPFPFNGDKDVNNPCQEQLIQAGGEVRFNTDHYMHPKVVVIDDKVACIGSCNFYPPSLKYNREVGVITADPAVLADLLGTFIADWAGAKSFEEGKSIRINWPEIVEVHKARAAH